MIKISDLRVPQGADMSHIKHKAAHILRISEDAVHELKVLKRSTDARKKGNIVDVYTITLAAENEDCLIKRCNDSHVTRLKEVSYHPPKHGREKADSRPVVIGFGPAGIFAALLLAREGYEPIVYERGKPVDRRAADVERFFTEGVLDTGSNVQFGEGGAGTFSDGKLSTGIKDRDGRKEFVLDTMIRHGADPEIKVSSHPHIGTDRLIHIIPGIREEIEDLGGEIRFESLLDDIVTDGDKVAGIVVRGENGGIIPCDSLFLCPGHSARDTTQMLFEKGLELEAKPFAVGVRAEHSRSLIDGALGQESASYKLTYHAKDGRGVYSFCMCPGGYVVNSSSEKGHLTVNGMSYSGRDGDNSNAAIVCTVGPEDYSPYGDDPLAGMRFQRELERRAYEACRKTAGAVPYQRYGDFVINRETEAFGRIIPCCKGRYGFGNIRDILPENICNDIIEAMRSFGRRIPGYDDPDALFAGIEARTSSSVRIIRDDSMQSVSHRGIYPVGEGAGYAGGIMSAAIDGMKAAEAYIRTYRSFRKV